MNNANALILFPEPLALRESNDGKAMSRIAPDDVHALFMAMLDDVMEQASELEGTDVILYHNGDVFSREFMRKFATRVKSYELRGGSFDEEIRHALENAVADGYARLVVMAENQPTLGRQFLQNIFGQLTYEDNCVVFGPTFEESFYLFGMKSDHQPLMRFFSDPTTVNSEGLLEHLCMSDTVLFPTQPRHSLTSRPNLERLKDELQAFQNSNIDVSRRTLAALKVLDRKTRTKPANR